MAIVIRLLMSIKKNLALVLFLFLFGNSFAQQHHVVYAEALGAGLLGSFNYEFRSDDLGFRFGAGLSPKYVMDLSKASHPVSTGGVKPLFLAGVNILGDVSYSKAAGEDLELGVNFLYAPKNSIADKWGKFKETDRIIPSVNIGYRSQPEFENSSIVFRVCYSPYYLDRKIHQLIGLSVGYHFD
jgi:hypothetical protein